MESNGVDKNESELSISQEGALALAEYHLSHMLRRSALYIFGAVVASFAAYIFGASHALHSSTKLLIFSAQTLGYGTAVLSFAVAAIYAFCGVKAYFSFKRQFSGGQAHRVASI